MSYTIQHFSLNLPQGEGQDNIPALLKHLASELEKIQNADISDIVFHNDLDQDSNPWPLFTVYYDTKQ